MKIMLYFAEANGADAEADAVVVPAENVLGIHPTAATTCNVYYKHTKVVEGTDADATFNYVELTYTSGKFKEVCEAIVGAMNGAPATNSGFVVIADGDNSKFISPHISAALLAIGDSNVNPDD
tara:strand:- start:1 stop:369 length:369 start_codon:yes stop_codon:yes gene_type:complete